MLEHAEARARAEDALISAAENVLRAGDPQLARDLETLTRKLRGG